MELSDGLLLLDAVPVTVGVRDGDRELDRLTLAVGVIDNDREAVLRLGDRVPDTEGVRDMLDVIEGVDDPWSNSDRLFLFLRQARLSVNGDYKDLEYEIEWMLGGEEVPGWQRLL